MSTDTIEIWVCIDCTALRESGTTEFETPPDREPWSLLPDADVTIDSTCENCFEKGLDDCDDGYRAFSWSTCDGCGSTLGGARFRYALWPDKKETP